MSSLSASARAALGISTARLRRLRRAIPRLHGWYAETARELPWRQSTDPYRIWVAEVMLQQTQVATVVPYFERWMERFPDVERLAAASEADVLLAWQGLGYYGRARRLRSAAEELVARHGGRIPRDRHQLLRLPGVGEYTAAAVASIAFGVDIAAGDGNVRRVLGRLVALEQPATRASAALAELARALLPRGKASVHNQALMELGALVCSPRAPRCGSCPLAPVCRACDAGEPTRYPAAPPRRAVPRQLWLVAVVVDRGRLLFCRRPASGLLAGMWDLPSVVWDGRGEGARALRAGVKVQYGLRVVVGAPRPTVEHAYTHLKVTIEPYRCRLAGGGAGRAADRDDRRWVARDGVEQLAVSRASHKVLEALSLAGC